MRVTEFLIAVSIITARTCRSEIVLANSRPDKSSADLIEDLVKIVTSCYEDRPHTVGLAGNLPEAVSRILSTEHLIPIILITNARNSADSELVAPEQFRHKIPLFIIDISTWKELTFLITDIKFSIWWNQMASFIILDRSPKCANHALILRIAWCYGIINAKVLCSGTEAEGVIVNYNPFTSQAPYPWQQLSVVRMIVINDHPFTIYLNDYARNKSYICMNLDFEKTNDLGGYKIRVDGSEESIGEYSTYDRRIHRLYFSAERIQSLVYRVLNAKAEFSKTNAGKNKFFKTHISKYGTTITGPLRDSSTTYPHHTFEIIILSQFRGYKSKINEMFHALDTYVWIGVGIVYLITFIFFKFYVRQSIMPALLNILRVTCNTGFTNVPDDIPSRIYLSCLYFFWTIIQGLFLCHLASLLTTKFPLQNVNGLEDVETLGHKLCVGRRTNAPTSFKGPLIFADDLDCFKYVKNSSSVSFFVPDIGMFSKQRELSGMHVSEKFVTLRYISFAIQKNWALEEPVNRIIAKLVEADALFPWDLRNNELRMTDCQRDDEHKYTKNYNHLNLADLALPFIFLGIGLACATVCFIFELATPYVTRSNCIRRCMRT